MIYRWLTIFEDGYVTRHTTKKGAEESADYYNQIRSVVITKDKLFKIAKEVGYANNTAEEKRDTPTGQQGVGVSV